MITRLFEVAVAVKDFDDAVSRYSAALDLKPIFMKPEDVPSPGLKIAIFPIGNVALSLIGSEAQDTAITKHINAKGEGLYLIGIEVTDIEQDTKRLMENGIKFVSDNPLPYIAGLQNFSYPKSMNGVQICWAQHKPDFDVIESPKKLWGSP